MLRRVASHKERKSAEAYWRISLLWEDKELRKKDSGHVNVPRQRLLPLGANISLQRLQTRPRKIND